MSETHTSELRLPAVTNSPSSRGSCHSVYSFKYITYQPFHLTNTHNVDANLDAQDHVISGIQSSSEMLRNQRLLLEKAKTCKAEGLRPIKISHGI